VRTVLFDIDGVIADCSHRLHFIQSAPADWDGFFDACSGDAPIWPTIKFLWALHEVFKTVYVTGRPERIREKTKDWLKSHGLGNCKGIYLLMRKDDDHRPDFEVKRELFLNCIEPDSVFAVVEDRDQVVEMWRKLGLLCLQPKRGDY
jgi:hypothetical protein